MKKITILTSGNSRGSNFLAIANYLREKKLPIEISFVLITKKNPPIKEKCNNLDIATCYIPTKDFSFFEEKLSDKIIAEEIDLLVFAGFMKKISKDFLKKINIPVINIHPALLPKYGGKGMFGNHVHKAVFNENEKYSGATVHYVNEKYDEGNIIEQEKIEISACKSPKEIGSKVLDIEHRLYPRVIEKLLVNYEENSN